MKSLRRIVLVLLLLWPAVVAAAEPAKEPVFANRSLSQWIGDLDDSDALVREEAIEVLGRIGRDAKRSVPKLEKILASDLDIVRRRAAVALWKIDGRIGPAKELYTDNLKQSKRLERLKSVEILRQLGTPQAELAPYLIDLVVDADYTVSNPATVLLQQFGKDGIPAMTAAVTKARGESAIRLVSLVSNLGVFAKPLVPVLQQKLKDPEPRLRMACVRTLWYMDEDRKGLAKLVVEMSKDKDLALQREATFWALSIEPKPKEFEPVFRDALKSTNNDFRYRAVAALWQLDHKSLKENLKILIDAVKQIGREGYWYSAVQALQTIGPDAKEALPALLEALNGPNGINYSYNLVPAIARMGPDAVEPLVKNLGSTNYQLQQASRQGLMTIGTDAVPKLLPFLGNKDRRACLEVLQILNAFAVAPKEAVPKLIELLKENDPAIANQALALLGRVGPEAAQATPELVKLLGEPKKNVNELRTLIRAVSQIGPGAKAAVPELKKLLKHDQASIQAEAAEALLRVDSGAKSDAAPVLMGVLRDKKPGININTVPELLLKNGVNAAELMKLLQEYVKAQPAMKLPLIYVFNNIHEPVKESAPLLRELMKDPNANVRYEAAVALARLKEDGKEAIPELRAMLKQPAMNWRDRAVVTLATLGPVAKEALPDLLDQWRSTPAIDMRIRQADAILAIDREKGKPALEWLHGQTANTNVYSRVMVLRTLAKHDVKNPEVLKGLLALTKYQYPYYAGLAFEVIGLMGAEAKSALPEIRAALNDPDVGKRARAAGALWKVTGKSDEALSVLIAALKEHDLMQPNAYYTTVPRTGATAAAWTLGEIGPPAKAAVPALRDAMKLGDASLRQTSLTAIGKIEKN